MAVKRFSEFRKGNNRIKVYAKGFNSNRSVQLTGNVTGSAQSDMDEGSTLSIATTIADNAVTNSKLSDGAVSTSKLNDDAVTSAKIDTGAVTVNKLGASAVETDKIANGAVTLQKISTSAIDDEPTNASDNLVTSGGVKAALDAKADKVDDAIEGNFAGLDANGNITDSGISQDSVESAISSAGSAIQGVKVNNTTLTPDASKVVTVPLATASSDGAMSAADKTKLNNAATYTQSSGTAPVKVDENGALTPVPMDSTPTASSTNLMTSGGIKNALDALDPIGTKYDVVLSNENSSTPAKLYEISNMGMTSNYSASTAEFIVYQYGADYYDYGNASYKVTVHWTRSKANVEVNGVNITGEWTAVVSNSATPSTTDVTTLKLYLKPGQYRSVRVSLVSCKRRGATGIFEGTVVTGTTRENIPSASDLVIIGTTRVGHIPRTFNVSSKGSASVPVYVDADEIKACTDDFVHDGDIKRNSDVSGMGTDDTHAYSGKAVSTAISNAITGTTGGFLGNKTVAEINAYASPKMGDNAIVTDTGTIIVGNTLCTILSAPAEIRWTTDGSWVVTSSNYVNKNDVATAQTLGLVKTNPTDGGVELNSNNQMVVHGWDGKASASDVTSLTTRVTSAEGDISSLQSSVAGKINTSDAVWTIDDSDDAIIVDDDFMTWMFQA